VVPPRLFTLSNADRVRGFAARGKASFDMWNSVSIF
jgi:hypothetical protein